MSPASVQSVNIPAPVGGLNTIDAGATMPDTDCVQLFNLVSSEYGLRSRLGNREWVTGMTGAEDSQVRTLLPFTGAQANGAGDKLFAATSTGIWDVSASSAAPVQVFAFGIQAGESGRGIFHGFVNSAGAHFLLYCDEVNGYHVYTASTDTWAAVALGGGASEVAGVDPANLCFVMAWKSRLWFVEKNTATAWYLAAGALYGTATKFTLGSQFRAGGPLVGLWNWTLDGGIGIDDYLVAISQGGDVAVYKGTDPASATTFTINGTWSAGALPAGRRVASSFGGDLLILTKSGIRPLSQLASGGDGAGTYLTAKVGNLFNQLMLTRSELPGWAIHLHPEDNTLLILAPTQAGEATEQLAQALWNRSWSRYRSLPIFSACVWGKKLYFGTVDGKACINDGYVDGVTLADPSSYAAIQWSLLTAFRNLGNGRQKRVEMIRPTFLAGTSPVRFDTQARFSYDLTELGAVADGVDGGWDVDLWDDATWAGDYLPTQAVRGASGMGTDVAIALRGLAKSRTVLVGLDVMFTQGGLL